MAFLDGLKILVPESRELDLFATMLEAEGAGIVRCPLVQILDLEDATEVEAWIEMAVDGVFQDIVWLTGEGIRRLVTIAVRTGREKDFIEALRHIRSISRGPKPARALRELELPAGLPALSPTSQGIFDALMREEITGRAIGVQLYPGATSHLLDQLQSRGARAFPVTPYRYATDAETGQVSEVIRALAAGKIGLVAFTATPQVERLFRVARESGLQQQLELGLAKTPVAAIGPVVEEALGAHGISSVIRPRDNFHLKPFVRAIAAWRAS